MKLKQGEVIREFYATLPCDSTEFKFRKRISKEGIEKIFAMSVALYGKISQEKHVVADTTVQEKNIIYPIDGKLAINTLIVY